MDQDGMSEQVNALN